MSKVVTEVLVIDDNNDRRNQVCDRLKYRGVSVLEAVDEVAGISLLNGSAVVICSALGGDFQRVAGEIAAMKEKVRPGLALFDGDWKLARWVESQDQGVKVIDMYGSVGVTTAVEWAITEIKRRKSKLC